MRDGGGLGYDAFWHLTPYYNPENFYGNPINVFGPDIAINMLCLPRGYAAPGSERRGAAHVRALLDGGSLTRVRNEPGGWWLHEYPGVVHPYTGAAGAVRQQGSETTCGWCGAPDHRAPSS